ncbi:MAG TPA: anthranilate synthase component II [Spirochaeta sp.]|nr:anthranilate synthase component II [Spirochaeta sp.]
MHGSGRTVIIDFNDSFTYNIFELLRTTGCRDISIQPISSLDVQQFEIPDRIILSPGPGLPDEYPEAFRLLDRLLNLSKPVPVLGICLGHQLICSYFGAGLYNLDSVVHGQPCLISKKADDSLFHGMPESFTVGLYHSWAVVKPLPQTLRITAESKNGIIMAAAHENLPVWGIQFHPESFISEYGEQLLTNFINL